MRIHDRSGLPHGDYTALTVTRLPDHDGLPPVVGIFGPQDHGGYSNNGYHIMPMNSRMEDAYSNENPEFFSANANSVTVKQAGWCT